MDFHAEFAWIRGSLRPFASDPNLSIKNSPLLSVEGTLGLQSFLDFFGITGHCDATNERDQLNMMYNINNDVNFLSAAFLLSFLVILSNYSGLIQIRQMAPR